jgi:hypothetical protein
LCFLGYGIDNDTYAVLDAGRSTWALGQWQTSRNPGYWLYEAVVYGIARLGGSIATNVASLLVGAFVLWRLLVICERLRIRNQYLIALCAVATPTFLIACTSTMDYLWSIACLIVALESMTTHRMGLAILAGVLAVGFRPSNCIVLGGMYAGTLLYLRIKERGNPLAMQYALAMLATVLLAALFFVPSFMAANRTMDFLKPELGPASMWSWKMHAGRFVCKTLYVFGPLAACFLGVMFFTRRKALALGAYDEPSGILLASMMGGSAAALLLFARFPVEISYLLPGVIFTLPLAALTVLYTRVSAAAFLMLVASSNFLSISLAQPNIPGQATDATIHPALATGALLQERSARLRLRHCETYDCYLATITQPAN